MRKESLFHVIRRKRELETAQKQTEKVVEKHITDELTILQNYGTVVKMYNYEDGSMNFDVR